MRSLIDVDADYLKFNSPVAVKTKLGAPTEMGLSGAVRHWSYAIHKGIFEFVEIEWIGCAGLYQYNTPEELAQIYLVEAIKQEEDHRGMIKSYDGDYRWF